MFNQFKHRLKRLPVRITAMILICSLTGMLCSCASDPRDFDGVRFSRTRKITVLADSWTDEATALDVNTSSVAGYIHEKLLEECNIDVEFIGSDKLDIHNGIVADISYTNDYNQLSSFYRMGAVINLSLYLDEYSYALTDLTDYLGGENIRYCSDDPSEIWYLTAKDDCPDSRITFIRSDWLDKLGLEKPSNIEEFHNCLTAFRDNSELLLGEDASDMIPFFIDSEPNISAKPLFDSCLDTSISDREFFDSGYCRIAQDGYEEGLRILNQWYLEALVPDDFMNIRPSSKESYEPIENGFVGAFCAKCDYLYANGENSHIKALHDACGEEADYVAVNTFADRYGSYTAWQEDYLHEDGTKIFLPSACSDPLACLVYLNWISDPENIERIRALSSDDPFTYDRYLLTGREMYVDKDIYGESLYKTARQTADEVEFIHHGSMCIRYGPEVFKYVNTGIDYSALYPDSAKTYLVNVITAGEGEFDDVFNTQYEAYIGSGAEILYLVRDNEWDKVMVRGNRKPD